MFEKIVGNEEVKKYLVGLIENNKIANSYIFLGESGIGKKAFAKEYAKELLCLNNGKCNNTCESCDKFNNNANPDFKIIAPEGKEIQIDKIRDLQTDIVKKPILAKRKVYIIDDANLMNEKAQNCFLKTLEEPPQYAIIILIVSNESMLLPTVKSRCVTIKFKNLSRNEIKQIKPDLTDDVIELLNGSLQNIEEIIKKQDIYVEVKELVESLEKDSLINIYKKAEILYNNKGDIFNILDYMCLLLFKDGRYDAIQFVEKTKEKLRLNNNYVMSIDYMLMNIAKQ